MIIENSLTKIMIKIIFKIFKIFTKLSLLYKQLPGSSVPNKYMFCVLRYIRLYPIFPEPTTYNCKNSSLSRINIGSKSCRTIHVPITSMYRSLIVISDQFPFLGISLVALIHPDSISIGCGGTFYINISTKL